MKLSVSRWVIAIAAAFPLLCAYSCAVPLGPGYHIQKETVELTFENQPKPLLHLDGHYRIENVGNAPLTSLEVTVPSTFNLGQKNLRVTVDGADTPVEGLLGNAVRRMSIAQISFQPPWLPHQKKEIGITCDIPAGVDGRAVLASNAFAFDGSYWFPSFQTPARLFAKGELRADPTDLSIVIPKDFRAAASGQQTGRKIRGDKVGYRFRLRETDGAPFVVAGSYKEQLSKNKGVSVYFWTFQGLSEDAVESAGQQLAAAAQFFDSNFVARARGKTPIWVVEIPENQIVNLQDVLPGTTSSFPNMVLLDKEILSQSIGRGQVSANEIGVLSDTWLQWTASPKEDEPMLQDTLGPYMVDALYESRGASYRDMKIGGVLRKYDLAHSKSEEKPIAQTTSNASNNGDQLDMAVNKASLFLYALENACTAPVVRHSIGRMVSTRRGADYGYQDLRAALNIECGQPQQLDALFRAWLYEKGIPPEFRARYAGAALPKENR